MSTAAATDRGWLLAAIGLSRLCPVSSSAYAVGAIIVDADGGELARGYSREVLPTDHAEESVLAKAAVARLDLRHATLYTSLEPCTARRSRSRTCTELILAAGIPRVVFAMHEPPTLADCQGAETLRAAGVEVIELPDLAPLVREVNAHLLGPGVRGVDRAGAHEL